MSDSSAIFGTMRRKGPKTDPNESSNNHMLVLISEGGSDDSEAMPGPGSATLESNVYYMSN